MKKCFITTKFLDTADCA